jgi:catechol 2,3-dioxygenase-like lactoylglutathione lyase family enzyme
MDDVGMSAESGTTTIAGIGHVELRVRNLQDSVRFYCDVFGLCCKETVPRLENQRVCVGVPASGSGLFGVVLSEGFPAGAELAGLDHVGMRVSTEQDVRDIYARARELGHRATRPRVFNGHFQAFVFDPDGYKLEVFVDRGGEAYEPGSRCRFAENDSHDPFGSEPEPSSSDLRRS